MKTMLKNMVVIVIGNSNEVRGKRSTGRRKEKKHTSDTRTNTHAQIHIYKHT